MKDDNAWLYEPNNKFTIYLSQLGDTPGFVLCLADRRKCVGWLASDDGQLPMRVIKESMLQLLADDFAKDSA